MCRIPPPFLNPFKVHLSTECFSSGRGSFKPSSRLHPGWQVVADYEIGFVNVLLSDEITDTQILLLKIKNECDKVGTGKF